jgi:hypothetical protein
MRLRILGRRVTEHAEPFDIGVKWEPNIEHGVLAIDEDGEARLTLEPYDSDPDQRPVVLVFHWAKFASMGPPNDEARNGHRLYNSGLRGVLRVAEVHESELVAGLEIMNRVHPRHDPARYAALRHWIILLKGRVVEVAAESVEVQRPDK